MLFTTVTVPTEGIAFQQPQTSVHMTLNGDTKQSGVGTIYVTESSLIFVDHANGTGFSIQYPSIVIHGISRETSTYPVPCIYMILNASGNGLGTILKRTKNFCADLAEPPLNDSSAEDGDSDTQSTSDNVSEMRFVPADAGSLDAIYQAIAQCSSLHPDVDDAPNLDFDDDEDGGVYGDVDAEEEGADAVGDIAHHHNGHDENEEDDEEPTFDEHGQVILHPPKNTTTATTMTRWTCEQVLEFQCLRIPTDLHFHRF